MSDPFFKINTFSVSPQGIPLVTAEARYWRGIHAEVKTHRSFSTNSRSSRAVPVSKMMEEIAEDPFVPKHWGKNQKGMQATEECVEKVWAFDRLSIDFLHREMDREEAWRNARSWALECAAGFHNAGYHKQIVNRLLEPFMMIDTLITSTNWANFFALRDHKDAEPHLRDLAQMAKEEFRAWKGKAKLLQPGEWHLPYITEDDLRQIPMFLKQSFDDMEFARRVSAARCARISYAPFDGNASYEAELARYDQLVTNWPVHASPVEHQATPDRYASQYEGGVWEYPGQHRNFRGWRQYRAMIPMETTWDTAETDRKLLEGLL